MTLLLDDPLEPECWRARESGGRWIIERCVRKDNHVLEFEFLADGHSERVARLVAASPAMLRLLVRLESLLAQMRCVHPLSDEVGEMIAEAGGSFASAAQGATRLLREVTTAAEINTSVHAVSRRVRGGALVEGGAA